MKPATPDLSAGPALCARGLSKKYRIWRDPASRIKGPLWSGLAKALPSGSAAARRLRGRAEACHREFFALRDLSFDLPQGGSLGIVGRNGAGKSTLLQILAGVLRPTGGTAEVRGRVSALLELGSGFNPEFTGRENVFLNGAILGIDAREMTRRFDAIAAFADIGEFIEQPVKTYSSGMFARLAFAVAISVDPDILIVDEILSVGDLGFQQKCVARLREMRDSGLTLLFVSHSPDAVKSVCRDVLFLEDGRASYFGPSARGVQLFLDAIRRRQNEEAVARQGDLAEPAPPPGPAPGDLRYGTGHARLESVDVTDDDGAPRLAFDLGQRLTLTATVVANRPIENLSVSFLVRDTTGIDLMGTTSFDERVALPRLGTGERARVRFRFPAALRAGNYGISVSVNRVSERDYSDNVILDTLDACAAFMVRADPNRPVHYKFHCPIEASAVRVEEPTP